MDRSSTSRARLLRSSPWFCASLALLLCGCADEASEPPAQTNELSAAQVSQAVQQGCAPPDLAGKITRAGTDEVDLLIVLDDSRSMWPSTEQLARALPLFAQRLVSGDMNQDGVLEATPVRSLRVAVTTTDVGSTRPELASFCAPGSGGQLRTGGYVELNPSNASQAPVLLAPLFPPPPMPADGFGAADEGGCAFEAPFEAALSALTGEAPYADVGGGWAAPQRSDFLRPDSVLAVLLVGDEDDCSALPPQDLLAGTGRFAGRAPNSACLRERDTPGALRPVSEFVAKLSSLRAGVSSRLVFGAIAGIPSEHIQTPASEVLATLRIEYDNQLGQPRLELPLPACYIQRGPEQPREIAYPAPRVLQVAAALGERGFVSSICAIDHADALTRATNVLSHSFEPMPACR